jgi:MYXO-CTERM domain-containing protein
VSSAQAVPELPTWAMMILCLAGLGLARFKRRRKNRLSQGIE